jgi:hypothetical protein
MFENSLGRSFLSMIMLGHTYHSHCRCSCEVEILTHSTPSILARLFPRNFYFFQHLKQAIMGIHFTTDDEVKSLTKERPHEFFFDEKPGPPLE